MTAQQKFQQKLNQNLHICVGLDTDFNKIPEHLKNNTSPIVEFNKIIIESTYKEAAAYKINFAFYEKDGSKGIDNLYKTLELIPNDVLTIADAKRGDIGNTSQMYAESIYNHFHFDSVTLHPYMGLDSLSPFFDYKDKLNFILALTSNKGSEDFEKLKLTDGKFLYQKVILKIVEWNKNQNCGLVFGATNSSELRNNISLFQNLPVLLPGVGTQGGSMEEVVKIFKENNSNQFLINISRSLIYADSTINFAAATSKIIKDYNSLIKSIS